ncbi:MAG: flavodoxin family protein [Methanosphaera stadtmanae]|nr:flavodoxin family protein [Methanosphaera stadtmanae]
MKILGINTSPRPGSNVKIALETALEAAAAKGAETELINTNSMSIKACQACNFCKANQGKCVNDDDMTQIYEKILEADAVIFGSPVYFIDITAQAKLVIDRLYAFFMEESLKDTLSAKKLSFIVTNGSVPAEQIMPALDIQTTGLSFLGFQIVDKQVFGDNNNPEAIKENSEQLAIAKKIGENLI